MRRGQEHGLTLRPRPSAVVGRSPLLSCGFLRTRVLSGHAIATTVARMSSTTELEGALRRLCTESGLPEPDEIAHREDGSILALWHDRKVAVVVEPEP